MKSDKSTKVRPDTLQQNDPWGRSSCSRLNGAEPSALSPRLCQQAEPTLLVDHSL